MVMLAIIFLSTFLALQVQGEVQGSPHLIIFGGKGRKVFAFNPENGTSTPLKDIPIPQNYTDMYRTMGGGRWAFMGITVAERDGNYLVIGGVGNGGMGWVIKNGKLKVQTTPMKYINERGWRGPIAEWIADDRIIVYRPKVYEIYNPKTNKWMGELAGNVTHESSQFSIGAVYNDEFYVLSMNTDRNFMKYEKAEFEEFDEEWEEVEEFEEGKEFEDLDLEKYNELVDLPNYPHDYPLDLAAANGPVFQDMWNRTVPAGNATVYLSGLGIAVYGYQLVACGGVMNTRGVSGMTNIAECRAYDFDLEIWEKFPSLNTARCSPGLAVAGGKLYAVGGYTWEKKGPQIKLDTVERYDEDSKSWVKIPYKLPKPQMPNKVVGVESLNKNTWYH